MRKKYIYANIRLPIEMSTNGSFYEVFSDRMTIDFELCKTLPEPTSYENKELIAKIFAIHHDEEEKVTKVGENEEVKEEEIAETEIEEEEAETEVEEAEAEVEQEEEEVDMKVLKRDFNHKINKSRHNMSFRRRFKANSLNKFTKRTYS
jgi:hypothetical protein